MTMETYRETQQKMKIYRFTEVLNDTISYFLLGDIVALRNYKVANDLPDDLATEFTTKESGDKIVYDGIVIPLADVENYPYTIIFNLSRETPALLKKGNDLQVKQDGYILKIENNELILFTWWILDDFTDKKIEERVKFQIENNKPFIELENGWYKLTILGGQTRQETGFEPTFEFLIEKTDKKGICTADIFKSYKLKSDEY